nr:Chain D, FLAG peptide [synthetic construct]
DYKDDDDK